MTAQALEQSALETKDKEQLLAIAKALGLKGSTRLKKSEIIEQILDTTSGGSSSPSPAPAEAPAPAPAAESADSPAGDCLLYTSPSPRDRQKSRMPSSA